MGKLVHQAGHAAESVPGTGSWNSEAMMAKLIYSAVASADGYIEDPAAASTGGCLTGSCSVSSTSLSSRPAATCTGAGCTRRCSTGKRPTRRSSHVCSRNSPASGRQREDRVFEDARIGVEREDTGRTGLRARPGPAAEVGRRA
jgi:hypothetical protein